MGLESTAKYAKVKKKMIGVAKGEKKPMKSKKMYSHAKTKN